MSKTKDYEAKLESFVIFLESIKDKRDFWNVFMVLEKASELIMIMKDVIDDLKGENKILKSNSFKDLLSKKRR
jgi:hypothetical protein